MVEKVGAIAYDVTLDLSQMSQAEREVARRLGKVGDEGDKLQARFTAIAAGISAAISAIAIEGFVSKVVAAQRQFDVLFSSLKTVTGGADQASASWERLISFASKTPYTLDQSVQGFVKLKALGLDPSERAMTSFGNTASAMGKDLTQMIEAVADASTGEFERLKEFGIKAKTQGDQVSFTFQGVTTTVKNSAKDITEYLTQIGEVNFDGAMKSRMDTLDGAMSNLEDSWQGLYLAIAKSGLGDMVADMVRGATNAIQELTLSIESGGLTEYFDKLKPVITAAEVAVVSLSGIMASRLIATIADMVIRAGWAAAAMVTMTSATTAFSAVVAALGGPIGIAITAIGLLALNWDKLSSSAKTAADINEESADRIAKALKKSSAAGQKDLQRQLADAQQGLSEAQASRSRTSSTIYRKDAKDADLAVIDERIAAYKKAIADIKAAMGEMSAKGGGAGWGRGTMGPEVPAKPDEADPEKLDKWIKRYGTLAQQLALEIKEAKKELGAAFTPELENQIREKYAKKGDKKDKFDQEAYMASLRKAQASEINTINETENEKLRLAKKNLDERKISEKSYAEAVTLITQDAEQSRLALMKKTQDEIDKQRKEEDSKAREAWEKKKANEKAVADYVFNLTKAVDPLAALEQEYKGKLALVTQYEQLMAKAGVDATEQGEAARTSISRTYQEQRRALAEQEFISQSASNEFLMNSLNALGQSASASIIGLIEGTTTATEVMRNLGRVVLQEAVQSVVQLGVAQVKNAVLEKTMAASKGAAYAASVTAQVAGMSALAAQNAFAATAAIPIVGPGLAPAAAAAAFAASSALGSPAIATAPVAGARQYGGPVSAGSLYRVNETGKSEMFVGANGSQYMIPNQSGKVVSADNVGGGNAPIVTVYINGVQTAAASQSYDAQGNALKVVIAEVSNQIRENSGPVWSALRSSTNVQGRL